MVGEVKMDQGRGKYSRNNQFQVRQGEYKGKRIKDEISLGKRLLKIITKSGRCSKIKTKICSLTWAWLSDIRSDNFLSVPVTKWYCLFWSNLLQWFEQGKGGRTQWQGLNTYCFACSATVFPSFIPHTPLGHRLNHKEQQPVITDTESPGHLGLSYELLSC